MQVVCADMLLRVFSFCPFTFFLSSRCGCVFPLAHFKMRLALLQRIMDVTTLRSLLAHMLKRGRLPCLPINKRPR